MSDIWYTPVMVKGVGSTYSLFKGCIYRNYFKFQNCTMFPVKSVMYRIIEFRVRLK